MGFSFSCKEDDLGLIRDSPPSHCTFKIESFSLLSKTSIERLESGIFEAAGYKWKLAIYPNGNKKRKVEDHISLYLTIADTSTLSSSWGVKAIIYFYVFDQKNDKYIAVQDKISRRFNGIKTEWGFDKFISLETFKDPSNACLLDDTCVFGAEVCICQKSDTCNQQLLTMMDDAVTYKHTWNVEGFSLLDNKTYSEAFTAGDHKWQILLYPKGNLAANGKSLSLFLSLDKSFTLTPDQKRYVDFTLRIIDQNSSQHVEKKCKKWLDALNINWGFTSFISLRDLNDKTKGFLKNNCCIVEAEVQFLGFLKKVA